MRCGFTGAGTRFAPLPAVFGVATCVPAVASRMPGTVSRAFGGREAMGITRRMHAHAHARFRIALLGYGTVGSALHRLLVEHREHIRHATGRDIDVTCALVREPARARAPVEGGSVAFVDSIDEVFAAQPDLVCEAIGGLEPAREHVLAALERGVTVVTANKQLVARHGPELFARAQQGNAQLRFEASVCGAIPVIKLLRESLAAARIERVLGILNGTTNYVLSSMTDSGASYDAALRAAQEHGYAEPDPTDDVNGADAAAKLAILAGIAFHTRVQVDQIATSGIDEVSADDVAYAGVLGCRVKLIGRAERSADGELLLDVTPMLVPEDHALAAVAGATNAVNVTGATFRELMIQGPGAGGPETASAMAADIVSAMGSTPSFLTRDPNTGECTIAPADARSERHYVRMLVPDRPGVLASVAQHFAAQDVSIERVIQERGAADSATLVLTTHPAPRPAVRAALDAGGVDDSREHTLMPMLEPTAQ